MTATPTSISIVRFKSRDKIVTTKTAYEAWHPLSASPRIYSHIPLQFRWGYEAISEAGRSVGLMGVIYIDEAFANVSGAVDPRVRGNGIGGSLLEALLSEIPPELTAVIQPTDVRTAAPRLLSKRGFHCEDAGVVETFLHDLAETPSPELDMPEGYDLTTVFGVPSEDLERVIHLERVWCLERSQPVGPRLIGDYSGPLEGFVVLAREKGGEVVGLANAEMTNVKGLGLTELFVVDSPHRRRGIGRALKAAQLLSARQFGWREVLVTVPEAEHPAARVNAELGGLGMDGLKWVRRP